MPPTALSLLTATAPLDSPIVEHRLYPLLDWMTDEAADAAPPKLTIYPDSRVAGVVAPAGRCLLDGTSDCWMVPRPADGRGSTLFRDGGEWEDFALAHVGSTWCELYEGAGEYVEIPTACLAGPGGHADAYARANEARAHYDDTDFQVARGRYVWSDVAGGLVFLGCLWPDLTERQIACARASACSVDYRLIQDEGQFRLVATCLVNVGGLPSRYRSITAAVDAGATVLISDEMLDALVAEAEDYLERAAVCAALGRPAPTITFDAHEEDPSMSGTSSTPIPTLSPPPEGAQHVHAPEGQACSCGKGAGALTAAPSAPVTEPDHPAVIAASGDVTPDAVADAVAAGSEPSPDEVASRRAAYVVVEESVPEWGDQITWAGGVGMFCDTVRMADGSEVWLVYPHVEGRIDYDALVGVPAGQATVTGSEYEWLDPYDWEYDDVVLEPAEGSAEAMTAAARPQHPEFGSAGARLAAGRRIASDDAPVARTPVESKVAQIEAQANAQLASLSADVARLAGLLEKAERREAARLVADI